MKFHWIDRINLVACLLLGATGYLFFSQEVGLGLTLGSLLMTFNFYSIRRLLEILILNPSRTTKTFAGVLLGFKFAVFLGLAALVMKMLPVNLFGFGIGVAVVCFTGLLTAGRMANFKALEEQG